VSPRTRAALAVALVVLGSLEAFADDDNGESVPLLVRQCADGTRCEREPCDPSCSPHSIYFGSRMECVFALSPREPYTWSGPVGQPFAPADWDQCDAPSSSCYWGTAADCAGCTNSANCPNCLPSVCGSGPCFHPSHDRVRWRHPVSNDVISTPTVASCTPGDAFYGSAHEAVENHCVFIGATDGFALALDEDPAHRPWFDENGDVNAVVPATGAPDTDEPPYGSCLWHFKTDSQVWRNPVAPSCMGHCSDNGDLCAVDDDCTGSATCDDVECEVLAASKNGFLGRFDRYPRLDETPDATAPCTNANLLTCRMRVRDWEVRLNDSSIAAQGGLVLVRNANGTEAEVDDPQGGETRLVLAGTSLGYRAVKLDTDVPPNGNGTTFHTTKYAPPNTPYIGYSAALQGEALERYGIQDPVSKTFFSGFGASGGSASGLASFTLAPDGSSPTLTSPWTFKRRLTPPAAGPLTGCGASPVSLAEVQFHRTSPVLSGDGDHVFITNRHASGADLSGMLLALSADSGVSAPDLVACARPSAGDGIVAAPAATELSCSDVEHVAGPDMTPCCWNSLLNNGAGGFVSGTFDRIVVLSKAQSVFVYDFCEAPNESGESFHKVDPDTQDPATMPDWGSPFAELRVQPTIAKDVGTFYFYDNNPTGERFFAYDLFDMDLKWVYDASDEDLDDNAHYCKVGVPAGGADCYLAPIPYVSAAPISGGLRLTIGAHHPEGGYLAARTTGNTNAENRVMGALGEFSDTGSAPLAALADVRIHNLAASGPKPWEVGCFASPPCTVDLLAAQGDLSAGANSIDVTVRTRFGKEGTTRVALNYSP
jgi:hypothetical protein